VTGAGESAALVLRLVSGPLADRTRRFWSWAIAGYVLTVVSVPALGISGALWIACVLVILERVGKAVRSPAKDTLLSHASAGIGRGRGFAVHEAMDQFGAFLGPLLVALILATTHNDYAPALGVLAIPGIGVVAVLWWLARRVPDPTSFELVDAPPKAVSRPRLGGGLPPEFWKYSTFTATTVGGSATFGMLGFHMAHRHLASAATIPIIYAVAMATGALGALAAGWLFDKHGPRTLILLPLLTASIPLMAFSQTLALSVVAAALWGAANGVQESTMRATVASLVGTDRRATAYGVYAAVIGGATLVGSAIIGAIYSASIPALIIVMVATQLVSIVMLLRVRISP
jgi:MFS family permease